ALCFSAARHATGRSLPNCRSRRRGAYSPWQHCPTPPCAACNEEHHRQRRTPFSLDWVAACPCTRCPPSKRASPRSNSKSSSCGALSCAAPTTQTKPINGSMWSRAMALRLSHFATTQVFAQAKIGNCLASRGKRGPRGRGGHCMVDEDDIHAFN